MTKQVFQNVQPIVKGFSSIITLQFTATFWAQYTMNLDNLGITFNDTLDDSTPLWTGTTAGGQIVRDNTAKTLTITIPQATTAAWDMDYIQFDLMRYNGATKYLIPGVWTWPVSKRVGINVPA